MSINVKCLNRSLLTGCYRRKKHLNILLIPFCFITAVFLNLHVDGRLAVLREVITECFVCKALCDSQTNLIIIIDDVLLIDK